MKNNNQLQIQILTLSDISFILPSRNNLKYLKWSYDSIRKNIGKDIWICMADDASNDGTFDWMKEIEQNDSYVKIMRNEGPKRKGHTILYNEICEKLVTTPLGLISHADMFWLPNSIENMIKHIKPKTIVSATRIEPVGLHPAGPEKHLINMGLEPEEFKEKEVLEYSNQLQQEFKNQTTEGVFCPWMFWVKDFQEIGGHDEYNFAPQSFEDSEIFNRFQLNGIKFTQSRDAFVAHLTCRGSRFNPFLTTPGTNSKEWEEQKIRSARNFIRKWGSFVKHDTLMKPIIPHKYDIGYKIKNCKLQHLFAFEPWCDTLISDCEDINNYINTEQPNTKFNLNKKLFSYKFNLNNDVQVEFDASKLTQNSISILQQLSEIISESGEIGEFELDIFKIKINNLTTYENELIHIDSQYYQSKLL